MILDTRLTLRKSNSVILQAATGAGKTRIAADIFERAAGLGHSVFFLVHRQEIGDQAGEAFDELGLEYGKIASGEKPDLTKKIQICSIQTLYNLIQMIENGDGAKLRKNYFFRSLYEHEISDAIFHIKFPDLIIFDEAHHCKSHTWEAVKTYYAKSKCVGLSATPKRLDGRGLGDIFDGIICGPSMKWLIQNGFLSDYIPYAPYTPDMAGVKKTGGDYNKKEADKIMDRSAITGDAIKHYKQLADGRQALVFCTSIKHSKHIAAEFTAAGYVAEHLDSKLDKKTRKKIITDFREKKIQILCNVDLVGEGFNVPAVEVCILLRPTASLTIYLQQVGRCLRAEKGKPKAIILDHAGNILRHGLPDEDRNWELEFSTTKKKAGERKVATKICDQCYHIHPPAPACPNCGFQYEGRQVEQVEGELVEIDKEAVRQHAIREQASAQTLEELIALGKKRGYKDSWAHKIFNFRKQKQIVWQQRN